MVVTFGKYKGKDIKEIPLNYLEWASKNISNSAVKKEFEIELKRRLSKDEPTDLDVDDDLIHGKDKRKYVVNISVTDDKVHIYYKDGTSESYDYSKWYLTCDKHGEKLKGYKFFDHIVHTDTETYNELQGAWDKRKWVPRTPEEGFMLLNGVTYYKGMKVEDVSLMSIDIEAEGFDPNAKNAVVGLISCTFRRDGKFERKLFDLVEYNFDEQKMIADFSAYVNNKNPDIIIGHNILSYDLPYLNRGKLTLGRDGSEVVFDEKPSKKRKDGSQSYEYYNAFIHGREIVDTLFLSITYDVARNFPSYGLKQIEQYLGIAENDRIEWDFSKYKVIDMIDGIKKGDAKSKELWEKFKKYCSQDSDSPILLFDLMAPAFFYMNQAVPKKFQQMINEATGSQLDSLMIRSYLQQGYSIPKTSPKVEFEGAISMGIPGRYENVRKVDVASLYPSIMLQYEIYDEKKDPNKHLLKILKYFRDQRLANKKKAKETGDKYFDDLQGAQKILINSLYGYMGAGYLLYNYPKGAAEVTERGREILQQGVEWATGKRLVKTIKKVKNKGKENEENAYHWVLGDKISEGKNYELVNVDTDSFSYTNGKKPTIEEFNKEINELNKLYPELISWENDGIIDRFVVVKSKNYIMKMGDKVKVKGSSLTDQKKEPALLSFLDEIIQELLGDFEIDNIKEIYTKYCKKALHIEDITEWCTKRTYTSRVKESDRTNETKIVDAIEQAKNANVIKSIQEGDKIYLYQAIDGMTQKITKGQPVFDKKGNPKMIENQILKFPELYNNDADNWHYVSRVRKTLEILKNLIDMNQFIKYTNKANRAKLLK